MPYIAFMAATILRRFLDLRKICAPPHADKMYAIRTDRCSKSSRGKRFLVLQNVRTGSGAHPASYVSAGVLSLG